MLWDEHGVPNGLEQLSLEATRMGTDEKNETRHALNWWLIDGCHSGLYLCLFGQALRRIERW